MGAENVVRFLSDLFADLDDLAGEHGLVPIKTLGDGYMAVGGLFDQSADHIGAALELSLAMRDRVARRPFGSGSLAFRIGVDTGPAVAAVVGRRKFSYDLWGEAVNAASRMESHGLPGEIQVTARVESAARDRFVFEHRGIIPIKGLGEMDTYLLKGRGTGGVSPP
jgi:guanylate cyclase